MNNFTLRIIYQQQATILLKRLIELICSFNSKGFLENQKGSF